MKRIATATISIVVFLLAFLSSIKILFAQETGGCGG